MTKPLIEDLRKAAEAPAPKDFRPGVKFAGRMPDEITTDAIPPVETEEEWEQAVRAMGVFLPEGYGLHLVEAVLAGSSNEAAWHRDPDDKGISHTAYTAPNTTQRWRYRFKVVLKDPRADGDIASLMREAKRAGRGRPLKNLTGKPMVIDLADFQTGKADILGGSAELLERSEVALAAKLAEHKRLRPSQVFLVDLGDSTEGFESAPNAARVNDLQITEQVRVWRRIFWRWIESFARVTEDLTVISVPSNHCRVRKGKDALGTAHDDWGIEVLAQVHDIAQASGYGQFDHVTFLIPEEHDEHVLVETNEGTLLGFIHGHQVSRPDAMPDFLKRNGRQGVGQADVVFVGHFHHLRIQAFGHGQTMIVCPTNDSGSSWYAASGENSRPGVLSATVSEHSWDDLDITWTA